MRHGWTDSAKFLIFGGSEKHEDVDFGGPGYRAACGGLSIVVQWRDVTLIVQC